MASFKIFFSRAGAGYWVPALLIAVACCQLWLAGTAGLTQWKGGGFGMFSTVDSHSHRFVKAYLSSEDGSILAAIAIPMSAGIREAETRARAMPSERRLNRLISLLENSYWNVEDLVIDGDFRLAATPENESPHARSGDAPPKPAVHELPLIVIEVWGLSFNRETGILSSRKVGSYEMHRDTSQPSSAT